MEKDRQLGSFPSFLFSRSRGVIGRFSVVRELVWGDGMGWWRGRKGWYFFGIGMERFLELRWCSCCNTTLCTKRRCDEKLNYKPSLLPQRTEISYSTKTNQTNSS